MSNKAFAFTNDWARPNCDGKYGAVGWYRIINPLEKIGADVERGKYMIGTGEDALKMRERGSVWIMKPMADVKAILITKTNAEFTGAKIVLDIDDDPFTTDPEHPQYAYHKAHEEVMKMQIEMAHHIVVSTEPLKNTLSKYHDKITVIPNAIDTNIWKVKKKKKRTDGMIRIGWAGSASHLADRSVIEGAIMEILAKYPNVEFHHAGMAHVDGADHREYSHKGTKGYEEYPQFLSDLDLDIAIAPLKDTPFNRAKSNIKWLEHSMLKTPMVLNNVYPYSKSVTHGVDGFLANSKGQWVKYLSNLIENADKRKEMGENAYKKVISEWNIEKQLPKYRKLIERLTPKNITVYTSLVGKYDTLSNVEYNANQIAFTDQKSKVWEIRKPYNKFKDDTRNSRAQKILPHLFLDTEYSIYLDANIDLLVDPQILIDEFLKDKDIAVFRHCGRDCIYDEAEAIVGLHKDTGEAIGEQVKNYAKRGIKRHSGLCECGVIIRSHTKRINELNEKWWAEYCRFSRRDQMSFPVVFPLEEVCQIEGSAWRHKYFKMRNHN